MMRAERVAKAQGGALSAYLAPDKLTLALRCYCRPPDPDRESFIHRAARIVGAPHLAQAARLWDEAAPDTVCAFLPGRAPVCLPTRSVPAILEAYGTLVAIPWRS